MFGVIAGIAAGAIGLAYHNSCADARTKSTIEAIDSGVKSINYSICSLRDELKRHHLQEEINQKRLLEDKELMAHISTDDYENYLIHKNASDFLEEIRKLIYHHQMIIVNEGYKDTYHQMRNEQLYHPLRREYLYGESVIETIKHMLYSKPDFLQLIMELYYISCVIDNSSLIATSFNSNRKWDGNGSFVELRGKEAANYFNQKWVTLHYDNIFDMLEKCYKKYQKLLDLRNFSNDFQILRKKAPSSPATKVDNLKYFNVAVALDCLTYFPTLRGYFEKKYESVDLTEELNDPQSKFMKSIGVKLANYLY